MAIEDYIQGSGAAAIAYRNAVNQSQDTINQLFRSYGWNAPGANGYSVESAQSAFDPNKVFDINTGGVDIEKIKQTATGLGYGGTGILADISRGGAAEEANVLMGLRQAGIGKGGLAAQRRSLAEAQTGKQMTGAKSEFLAALGGAYAPLSTAYQDVKAGMIADTATAEGSGAESSALPDYTEPSPVAPPVTPIQAMTANSVRDQRMPGEQRQEYTIKGTPKGSGIPSRPKGGTVYKGAGGVPWVYRTAGPKGPGWYKKGRA